MLTQRRSRWVLSDHRALLASERRSCTKPLPCKVTGSHPAATSATERPHSNPSRTARSRNSSEYFFCLGHGRRVLLSPEKPWHQSLYQSRGHLRIAQTRDPTFPVESSTGPSRHSRATRTCPLGGRDPKPALGFSRVRSRRYPAEQRREVAGELVPWESARRLPTHLVRQRQRSAPPLLTQMLALSPRRLGPGRWRTRPRRASSSGGRRRCWGARPTGREGRQPGTAHASLTHPVPRRPADERRACSDVRRCAR